MQRGLIAIPRCDNPDYTKENIDIFDFELSPVEMSIINGVDLVNYNEILPAVNQIETNLVSQQVETRQWMDKLGVRHQSYAPFGQGHINSIYEDDILCRIAERYGKTTRQVVLRFLIQLGVIVIPKTTHKERLAENFDVFDFSLLDNEMEILRSYDKATPLIGNPQNPALVESSKNW